MLVYPMTATASAAAGGLSINNIEVIYDHVILVLKGVSLEVPQGKIVALLGANGAGKGNLEDPSRLGNVMYTRGVVYGMIVVEAVRNAQDRYGKGKVITPEQLRWGFEHLDLTENRIKDLGAAGLFPPIKTSCADHEGSGMVKFQRWDGTGFKQVTPFMAGDRAMVRKMVEESAAKYAGEKKITPRDCGKED